MKKTFTLIIILLAIGIADTVKAQSEYIPFSYDLYQKFDADLYSTKSRAHTSLIPVFGNDTLLRDRYHQIMNVGVDTTQHHTWFYRKWLNEHLFDVRKADFTFYGDFLPDLVIGRDFANHENTYINTRGYQFGGTVGDKFYFYSSGYENQAEFPDYITNYINQTFIVPGQAYDRSFGRTREKDWSYVTAIVSYTPTKYLNITVGHDKNFIGDGYRSLLLSDYASPYPFLKLTANLGHVQYMAMWAAFVDPTAPVYDQFGDYRRKYGVFHYLDWSVTNRLSLGFFDSVIWAGADNEGHPRGFDVEYINPIIFLRPVEAADGSPDNALIGFTGKYKIMDGVAFYGQFALDEFEAKNFFSSDGSSRNKYAWQLGLRGADLFGIKNLNFLGEANNAKPYTYQERYEIINYAENNEPLAHPWGANFRELVGKLNYSYKRFDFSGELDFGHYGLDVDTINYGKDLWQDYTQPARLLGNYTGQGLTTNMLYLEGKVAFIINPKYNLRIEVGGTYRNESNSQFHDKTAMLTLGLRSSFRNIYNDLSSFMAPGSAHFIK